MLPTQRGADVVPLPGVRSVGGCHVVLKCQEADIARTAGIEYRLLLHVLHLSVPILSRVMAMLFFSD